MSDAYLKRNEDVPMISTFESGNDSNLNTSLVSSANDSIGFFFKITLLLIYIFAFELIILIKVIKV